MNLSIISHLFPNPLFSIYSPLILFLNLQLTVINLITLFSYFISLILFYIQSFSIKGKNSLFLLSISITFSLISFSFTFAEIFLKYL